MKPYNMSWRDNMKSNRKQIAAALLIGIALGGLIASRCPFFGSHRHWGDPEKFHHHMMSQFKSKLSLNTEQEQMLSSQYQIRSIPTLALFKNGVEIDRMSGALDGLRLVSWIRQHGI